MPPQALGDSPCLALTRLGFSDKLGGNLIGTRDA